MLLNIIQLTLRCLLTKLNTGYPNNLSRVPKVIKRSLKLTAPLCN